VRTFFSFLSLFSSFFSLVVNFILSSFFFSSWDRGLRECDYFSPFGMVFFRVSLSFPLSRRSIDGGYVDNEARSVFFSSFFPLSYYLS